MKDRIQQNFESTKFSVHANSIAKTETDNISEKETMCHWLSHIMIFSQELIMYLQNRNMIQDLIQSFIHFWTSILQEVKCWDDFRSVKNAEKDPVLITILFWIDTQHPSLILECISVDPPPGNQGDFMYAGCAGIAGLSWVFKTLCKRASLEAVSRTPSLTYLLLWQPMCPWLKM